MTSTPATTGATTFRPMILIGLGLVINMLSPRIGGWDVLPDWIGWLLILLGTWVFARTLPSRNLMLGAATGALAISAAQWSPRVVDKLGDAEPAVLWALSLPALGWLTLYCLAVAGVSRRDAGSSFWWKYIGGMNGAAAVLPIVVYGGKVTQLEGLLGVLMLMGLTGATVFSFYHSGRDWGLRRDI